MPDITMNNFVTRFECENGITTGLGDTCDVYKKVKPDIYKKCVCGEKVQCEFFKKKKKRAKDKNIFIATIGAQRHQKVRVMEFNINNIVKVKLNESGVKILKDEHDELNLMIIESARKPFKLIVDEDGFYETQLWSLMQTFGPHIRLTCEPPFETTIYLEDK